MYTPMFSPAAVACLVDGRAPSAAEIDEMASKIWHDVYARSADIGWNEVERGSRLHVSIYAAALVSLGAFATLGPDLLGLAA